MAVALTAYDESICPGCGLPNSVTRGDHNVGRVEFKDDAICHGCEPKENMQADKTRQQYPGQKVYPVVDHT